MTELLAQFHELPAVSLAAFALVAAAGLLMGVALSSLPLVSVVVGRSPGAEAPGPNRRAAGGRPRQPTRRGSARRCCSPSASRAAYHC